MGSWNATCGITQLPITEGTPVALIPLVVQQPDFMSRDSLSGGGSSNTSCIAKPISLPIFGTYDGCGGIDVEEGDRGLTYFGELLKDLVKRGRLFESSKARPRQVKKLFSRFFDQFTTGDLMAQQYNFRKEWLIELKKTIDASQDKSGFSHYDEQLKVDPSTLEDYFHVPLGYMMVPRELYEQLCLTQAGEDAFGGFDTKGKYRPGTGTRGDELRKWADVVNDDARDELRQFWNRYSKDPKQAEGLAQTKQLIVRAAQPEAIDAQKERFAYPMAGELALFDAVVENDAVARALWADFIMFDSVMHCLRKHWTPQAGAGNSYGLEEGIAAFYRVTNEFVTKTLAAHASEELEDDED